MIYKAIFRSHTFGDCFNTFGDILYGIKRLRLTKLLDFPIIPAVIYTIDQEQFASSYN